MSLFFDFPRSSPVFRTERRCRSSDTDNNPQCPCAQSPGHGWFVPADKLSSMHCACTGILFGLQQSGNFFLGSKHAIKADPHEKKVSLIWMRFKELQDAMQFFKWGWAKGCEINWLVWFRIRHETCSASRREILTEWWNLNVNIKCKDFHANTASHHPRRIPPGSGRSLGWLNI